MTAGMPPAARPHPRTRPDFSLEDAAGPDAVVCGVDEVGRGPIAGPVTAAAVILPRDLPAEVASLIDDSKKLTADRREAAAARIKDCAVAWAVASAGVAEIDDINILQAALTAMSRAVNALRVTPTLALVDGNRAPQALPCPALTVVRGDSRSLSVAAASILAKVDRDRLMADLDREFPGYGWAGNAGYPTPAHLAALTRLGATPHHRRSFRPVACVLRNTAST